MRYNDNREVNEMEHRKNGEREKITSAELLLFIGGDNYQNKVEEILLDILNGQYPLDDAVKEIIENYEKEIIV